MKHETFRSMCIAILYDRRINDEWLTN